MPKKHFVVLYIAIIAVIIGLVAYYEKRTESDRLPQEAASIPITSFEGCSAAGYPIAESYPEQCSTPDGQHFVRDIGNELEKQDLIRLDSPRPNATISSPLTIIGEARGTWYFEASFPIRLEDSEGNTIATAPAQAKGDWMTEAFVPFSSTIEFKALAGSTGRLILEKDNPSGLPEHDDALVIPIIFGAPSETMTVLTYFSNERKNQTTDCAVVFPVFRSIAKTQAPARAALEQLIAGPSAEEEEQGYTSPVPHSAIIKGIAIDGDGLARVDFSKDMQAAGSCAVTAIRAQIEQTLKQFPSIKNVLIMVEGNDKEALQP